eukprot:gene32838-42516_t
MSFGDLGGQKSPPNVRNNASFSSSSSSALSSSSSSGASNAHYGFNSQMTQLSDQLKRYQKQCNALRDRVMETKRRKIGPSEKTDLDIQIRELREIESRLKNQMDRQLSLLDALPRTEAAAPRAALGKLQKDLDRLRVTMQAVASDAAQLRVSAEAETDPAASAWRILSSPDGQQQQQQQQQQQPLQQQLVLKPLMHEQDVDQMIIEERERDIKKLNHDLSLIVETQGGKIDEIHMATETSHERAKAGLNQVKQAAAYQSSCSIS